MQKPLIVLAFAATLGCSGSEALRIVEIEPTVWIDRMPGPDGPSLHVVALVTLSDTLGAAESVSASVRLEAEGEALPAMIERVERFKADGATRLRATASARAATTNSKTATVAITLDIRDERITARVEDVEIQTVY
jgi:hypothetical protein